MPGADRHRGDRRLELVRRRRDPRRAFAIGVPAKATGSSSHKLSDARRRDLARRFVDDLHELLALRGHEVTAIENDGFEVAGTRVVFMESYRGGVDAPAVVLALDVRGDVPDGVAVLDLLGRRVHGSGGVVLDSVREFCRKRGIKLEPGPWSYPGGPRSRPRPPQWALGRQRREHVPHTVDASLDRDRVDVALDEEAIEARRVPSHDGIRVDERAVDDVGGVERRDLVADPNSIRAPAHDPGNAIRSAREAIRARDRPWRSVGRGARAPVGQDVQHVSQPGAVRRELVDPGRGGGIEPPAADHASLSRVL